jgi:catechol 2,3-dioxygenase-like lactoylglutathione lyase family enzyme
VPARISALALVVPDYDAAIAFYVGKLGFRLTEDIDQGRKRWVTVEPPGGGTRLVLARAEGPDQQAAIGKQAGGRVFLFLQTDDFARDHAAMLDAGVMFEEEPRHEAYGSVAVWRDPFGNRWDLIGPSRAG